MAYQIVGWRIKLSWLVLGPPAELFVAYRVQLFGGKRSAAVRASASGALTPLAL